MAESHLETAFWVWLGQCPEIPTPVREHAFHPSRKWRFDFAWPEKRFAVEIEGSGPGGTGRHQRPAGYLADAEKYEAAMLLGWTVYRVPGAWIAEGSRMIWRPEVMDTIRRMTSMVTDDD